MQAVTKEGGGTKAEREDGRERYTSSFAVAYLYPGKDQPLKPSLGIAGRLSYISVICSILSSADDFVPYCSRGTRARLRGGATGSIDRDSGDRCVPIKLVCRALRHLEKFGRGRTAVMIYLEVIAVGGRVKI